MQADTQRRARGRRTFGLMVALFALPLAAAWFVYFQQPEWAPQAGTNRGELLAEPVVLESLAPQDPLTLAARGNWGLLVVAAAGCRDDCVAALVKLRQVHIAQGKHRDRIERLLLVGGDLAPDTDLQRQFQGLHIRHADDAAGAAFLEALRPAGDAGLTIYLADPLTNVIMRYPPDSAEDDIYVDLKHLLKVSRIG